MLVCEMLIFEVLVFEVLITHCVTGANLQYHIVAITRHFIAAASPFGNHLHPTEHVVGGNQPVEIGWIQRQFIFSGIGHRGGTIKPNKLSQRGFKRFEQWQAFHIANKQVTAGFQLGVRQLTQHPSQIMYAGKILHYRGQDDGIEALIEPLSNLIRRQVDKVRVGQTGKTLLHIRIKLQILQSLHIFQRQISAGILCQETQQPETDETGSATDIQ